MPSPRAATVCLRFSLLAGVSAGVLLGACGRGEVAKVMGTEGRQRWVVHFAGAVDATEYRRLLAQDPTAVPAYVERRRQEMASTHGAFENALTAVNGRVVERWWMSNAVTIEVTAAGVPTVQSAPGVVSVGPDQPLQ